MSFEQIDYRYYLEQNRLKESDRFQPVFEAVENAFNAIEERRRIETGPPGGKIRILIHRDDSQRTIEAGDLKGQSTPPELTGVTIIDNGIGFRDENWQAFKTVYTSHKRRLGGKGVGRLSYLQAFGEATVTSTFAEAGKWKQRRFAITRTPEGVSDDTVEFFADADCETIVVLKHFEQKYRKKAPKHLDAITRSFVQHFFQRFSVDDGISCEITDKWDDREIDLHRFCSEEFMIRKQEQTIQINGHDLSITHSKCKTRVADKHEVMLCANGRVVTQHDVPKGILPTKKKLDSAQGGYFYVAFVNGFVLDSNANPDRLGFALEDVSEDGDLFPDDLPTIQMIVDEVSKAGREFLASDIDPLEAEHRKRIIEYCNKKLPYMPLLTHRIEHLMQIPFGLSEREFDKEVWSIYSDWKGDIRKRFRQMSKTVRENTDQLREFTEGYREIIRDMGQMAVYELAEYVTDRRAVIDFLDASMAQDGDGKFRDEDAIHDIFFPRKQTSNDIAWDESNLWLIDERLAFQQFAASDIPLRTMGLDGSVSKDRPDVAIAYDKMFDATFAFGDKQPPFSSLTLIEFKKPERKDYNEKEHPVAQALRYIREIRESKLIMHSGRRFRIEENSPIHIYVICHIVENLTKYMSGYTYFESPDGQGFTVHMPRENALLQIITFEKLIADAKKRNEVFFRKLGIDGDIELRSADESDEEAA
ncbi:Histidine kinase-, DNA gyrase B-, and HSP90-like ATPase [Rosistilla ulvae]|uniref:Histidine kinase-, DNA gyrase B-, and HSP90-like ATPase n=1 Tax=Rosistilla ulvae TaxID=1930277 RepID=A0A517M1J6_9BACT|nr:ATP-binding protein [Rosistilla ulvae]QDS88751.1 Histidine kinase-, DNA gyrase B-, and HSP90-like ATPase [Rosistilla ulvae]